MMQMPTPIARAMVRLGVLARITVVGRNSGVERSVIVNQAAAPDDGLYVAAGRGDSQWALNLRAAGRCTVNRKGTRHGYLATELQGAERDRAVEALAPPFTRGSARIKGPAFRLTRLDEGQLS